MTAPDLIDHGFIRHQLHRRGPVLAGAPHPLVTRAVEDIALRLEAVLRPFGTAAVISPVPTMLPGLLASRAQTHCVLDGRVFGGPLQPMQSPDGSARLLWADPTGGSDAHAQPMADIVPLLLDHEAMAFADASLDLVISLLTMQAVNDLPGHLVQIRRALRPDGLFLGVAFGDDTLHELREALIEAEAEHAGGAAPRVLPFADVRSLGSLLQRAGFALPVVDRDRLQLRYSSALALIDELRRHALANPLTDRVRAPLPRGTLFTAAERYAEKFAADGRVPATVSLVTLTGWAPDASQPQPLQPGSAKSRLADALGTTEHPAGDD